MERWIVIGLVAALGGCGDECSSYSHFTCSQIEAADYNVYFYFPSQSEVFLSQVTGLSQCQTLAHSYAAEKRVSAADWGYICCMIANGSSCYEKHR
jgi:hypothetical protein